MPETPESSKARQLREVTKLTQLAADSLAERDKAIVRIHGDATATPTEIGRAAGLTRGRVHQIVQREKSKA